jgi:hypothetical protein
MMHHYLTMAATGADDGSVSTTIFYGVITAIITAAVGAIMRYQGKQIGKTEERARQQGNVTIDSPIPEVTTRPAAVFIVRSEFDELKADMEKNFDELKKAMAEERRIAREAQGRVHSRSDANAVALAELKGEVHGMSKNVERLLTLATNPKPPRG